MKAAEVVIDAPLVRRLLEEQHPELAHLPISHASAGWDNAVFRLGEQLCVRLPRRKLAASLIHNEQVWLPFLASQLPIAVPVPLRIGIPSSDYPWHWSVLPWLPGKTADLVNINSSQAERFGLFLKSLHQPGPENAPENPFRGVPLSYRAAAIGECLQRLVANAQIEESILDVWQSALHASAKFQPKWLHGDLHPRNILVQNGVITGIIDWGDITAGDVATDLASLWMLFSSQKARQRAVVAYGEISEATLKRSKGWAILFGAVLLESDPLENPGYRAIGEKIIHNIAHDV